MSQFENDYLALDAAMGQMKLDDLEENDFLEHYQIKGAKHGVRRFQNYDGSLTPAGRERYGVGAARTKKSSDDKVSKKAERKTAREEKAAERKAKREAERPEKLKNYLRDHPKKIYKHRKKLNQKDLDELMKQVEFDKKCQDIKMDQMERQLKRFNKFVDTTKTINTLLSQSVGIYNNTALLYNAFVDNREERGDDVSRLHKLRQAAWSNPKKGEDGNKKKPDDEK